ncbi:Rossmann-like and DUF2520 domain-containing protein [Parasporobacterium paucivorans]|uniref:Predicted oxidoreductase, contains short-chain dehydrogenase (SDR) and DUF2520 domains n=1 Tax=Parasporobacterium paucivorans DSM 15970 TaxID=1122934 RepID=A0A1M6ALS2_9FIRM|nr:Rossmann-like and DUF2520 domain-containing protein [Parasporobacterium paucivorans]SHI37454.1 Predicted oxidoreductase, contains short-chain dehydrogenase (SDR) and DUF2520 domains [Parasporobacterium paucivorans DSM 15970]
MNIGIIGAGRVGCSIGKYLTEHADDCTVVGYFSRTHDKITDAADFTCSKAFSDLDELIKSSDTLLITTPDDSIKDVWDCIDKQTINGKIICHFSGSLSSDVFEDILEFGAFPGSVHPMYAFSDRFQSYKNLNEVVFTLEGHSFFLKRMDLLFSSCGNTVCLIEKDNKVKYHAAASMVSNHMLALLDTGISLLQEIGFSREDGYKVFSPLVKNNICNAVDSSIEASLTGPIERGDFNTVVKHLNGLQGYPKEVYGLLGKNVLEIAKRKNADKDYLRIERILNNENHSNDI